MLTVVRGLLLVLGLGGLAFWGTQQPGRVVLSLGETVIELPWLSFLSMLVVGIIALFLAWNLLTFLLSIPQYWRFGREYFRRRQALQAWQLLVDAHHDGRVREVHASYRKLTALADKEMRSTLSDYTKHVGSWKDWVIPVVVADIMSGSLSDFNVDENDKTKHVWSSSSASSSAMMRLSMWVQLCRGEDMGRAALVETLVAATQRRPFDLSVWLVVDQKANLEKVALEVLTPHGQELLRDIAAHSEALESVLGRLGAQAAREAWESKNEAQALNWAQWALELSPYSFHTTTTWAALEARKNSSEVVKKVERRFREHPSFVMVAAMNIERARSAGKLRIQSDAPTEAQKIVGQHENTPEGALVMAVGYMMAAMWRQAQGILDRSWEPSFVPIVRMLRAAILSREGKYEEAYRLHRQVAEALPDLNNGGNDGEFANGVEMIRLMVKLTDCLPPATESRSIEIDQSTSKWRFNE